MKDLVLRAAMAGVVAALGCAAARDTGGDIGGSGGGGGGGGGGGETEYASPDSHDERADGAAPASADARIEDGGGAREVGRPPATSALVKGAAGGQVSTGDGVTVGRAIVDIPGGALSRDTTVTIKPIAPDNLPDRDRVLGVAYDLGPNGTRFRTPVEITLGLVAPVPEGKVAEIAWLSGTKWMPLPSTVVGMEVRARADHFTVFAVLSMDPPTLKLDPTSFDFGATAAEFYGAFTRFTVTNTGGSGAALMRVAAVISGEFVILTDDCDFGVAPGDTCSLRVRAGPIRPGTKTGVLTVSTGTGSKASATLRGTATANPCIGVKCTVLEESCVLGTCTLPVVTSVIVWPEAVALTRGQSHGLHATAIYEGGYAQEITRDAIWTSSAATVAAFGDPDRPGRIMTLTAGSTTASATYAGVSGTGSIAVR